MGRIHYPRCVDCGGEINPVKYDGCEKYYQSNDGPLCRVCFLSRETDYLEQNTDEYAARQGVGVVQTGG